MSSGKFRAFMFFCVLVAGMVNFACNTESASETELEQMCDQLLVVRRAQGDTQMREQCIKDAHTEGVSRRMAQCRIHAVNKLEYWNRCRTGEPRPLR